jgi:hypothetical protein
MISDCAMGHARRRHRLAHATTVAREAPATPSTRGEGSAGDEPQSDEENRRADEEDKVRG